MIGKLFCGMLCLLAVLAMGLAMEQGSVGAGEKVTADPNQNLPRSDGKAAIALNAADGTPKQKPNIIFVLFDDMGYGQPKCYREGTEFKTPNLDRFATEGMRFTDAHSAASCLLYTSPSPRDGLLSRMPSSA